MLYCVLVVQDPVGSGDHVARQRHARVVDDVERDELRVRGGACIAGGAAGCDAGNEGAVPASVARGVVGQRGQVHGSDDAAAEVPPRGVDAGIDDGDRRRLRRTGRERASQSGATSEE